MDAFTSITLDNNLTKEQLQSQLATSFTSLVSVRRHFVFFYNMFIQARHIESVGLDSSIFILPNYSSRVSSILRPL